MLGELSPNPAFMNNTCTVPRCERALHRRTRLGSERVHRRRRSPSREYQRYDSLWWYRSHPRHFSILPTRQSQTHNGWDRASMTNGLTQIGHRRVDILGLAPQDLDIFLDKIGVGAHHSKRVFRSLHGHFSPLEDDPQFGRKKAECIEANSHRPSVEHIQSCPSDDGSVKLLFRLADGQRVEGFDSRSSKSSDLLSIQPGWLWRWMSFLRNRDHGSDPQSVGWRNDGPNASANRYLAQPCHASVTWFLWAWRTTSNYERVRSVIRILNATVQVCSRPHHRVNGWDSANDALIWTGLWWSGSTCPQPSRRHR